MSGNPLIALTLVFGVSLASARADHPNIVLIYIDDMGYGDLACYGSEVNDTPHVDRLAAEGMRFTDFYSSSPVCTPARASLMTGCYPGRVSFDGFGPEGRSWVLFPGFAEGLHPDERTLPELLKEKGYATAHIGKWHLGDQPEHLPTRHGFDSYYGVPYSNDMAIMPRRPKSPPMPLLRNERVIQEQPTQAALIERYTVEAVEFIQQKHDQPFFLYFAHLHVHLPHYVMEPFTSASRNERYGAAVAAIDWSTGLILAELRRAGIEDNTIVIFTSDNGSRQRGEGGSNAPLRGLKGQTFEGGMRVPCIVRWPGVVPAGSVSSELTSVMDFYPTLAALVGHDLASLPKHDGADVMPIWQGQEDARSPHEHFFYYLRNELQAVRDHRWKLHHQVKAGEESVQLYDLANDVSESNCVADQHPEVVQRLKAAMNEMREQLGDSRLGIKGTQRRPCAVVKDPRPLTEFDPDYPYIEPSYLLDEAG
ncbi:MAG: Cerebroside-sulfatase [Planctomycetaceae bacterium]|nr:MAG: Cerebroside-sulfatase [Planctomycetaceae bacterium]